MPRRNRHQDLNFEIHADRSCDNELAHNFFPTMDCEHTLGAEIVCPKDGNKLGVEKGSSALNMGGYQPTVVEVPDEAGGATGQHGGLNLDDEHDESSFAAGLNSGNPGQSFCGETGGKRSHVFENNDHQQNADTVDAEDSSSQHEHEDDVFSDNSPRSSMGSMSESDKQRFSPPKTRSTSVSDIPQSDQDEDFIPTVRGAPRPPFRSPSSVKALQMSSPPASVMGSPGSSRRTPRPTVSRLGSPSVFAQYSPKKTPPRFKRNSQPLVLLHVTVMPSRWPWGRVLDQAHPSELTPEGKALWDSWRQLQERTADTISDRGILLPHPQNDYEVLEERLLETLELPLRRRARILECGHYLGPSNYMTLAVDSESEDDEHENDHGSPRQNPVAKTHWCKTCHSDIRYDSLGTGRVFRVKVYASNGLMRAGAWEACWKEMERVDVELEPIVDVTLQEELANLAAEQERALQMEEEAAADAAAAAVDEELQLREEAEQAFVTEHVDVSPQPEMVAESCPEFDDGRQARDEERLREIYGHSPSSQEEESPSEPPRHSDFPMQQETPASPSAEACAGRAERRAEQGSVEESASLPKLFLEAVKVLLQDQKNLMIGLLGLLVLVFAVKGGGLQDRSPSENIIIPEPKTLVSVETEMQFSLEKTMERAADTVSRVLYTDDTQQASVQASTDAVSRLFYTDDTQPSSVPAPTDAVSKVSTDDAQQASVPAPADAVSRVLTDVTHQASVPVSTDACGACSSALEVVEVSLKNIPTSTVEMLSTITQKAFVTVTETMVETVTIEAVPTKAAAIETVVVDDEVVDAVDVPGVEVGGIATEIVEEL